MTVKELRNLLEHAPDNEDVVISLAPSGHICGRGGTVDVIGGASGFDWEMGMFVLHTEPNVDIWYEKCQKCDIRNDGRITSKMVCKDLKRWDFELQVKLDGKTMFKVPYPKEELIKKISGEIEKDETK